MTTEFSPRVLSPQVDAAVAALRKKWAKRLPGLTVALNRNGSTVFERGYGFSNVKTGAAMHARDRSPIGSTTKALVTSPAGYRLLREREPGNPLPLAKTLYGNDGVFGSTFDKDLLIGVRRHWPIIDVAIGPDDRVHAWYADGTFSIGTSTDLASRLPRTAFTAGEGQILNDICGIGIAGNGRVWTWYRDRTCSIGTPAKLDAHGWRTASGISKKRENAVACKLPKALDGKGQGMGRIVGIDIAKSDDHVHVWYEDGSRSVGIATDFGYYSAGECRPFTVAKVNGGSALEIRGVGISADDSVYAWFGNGKASVGTSTALAAHWQPYDYLLPAFPANLDRLGWYRQMTLQHLNDHTSGFTGSGNIPEAARMFGVAEAEVTYKQVHQQVLRTAKLGRAPGGPWDYSNHGMGLWTLVIERYSKQRFRNYVRDHYLKPLGLDQLIEPRTDAAGPGVAATHEVPGGKAAAVVKDFPVEEISIAAGGYRASAYGLAQVMLKLDAAYGHDLAIINQLEGGSASGTLSHGGSTGGGLSYAVMYPRVFTTGDGIDLGSVHAAVVANVSGSSHPDDESSLSDDLEALAKALAKLVHKATEPAGCRALHSAIDALESQIGTLEDVINFAQEEGGPVVKPPSAAKVADAKKRLPGLKAELAEAKAAAKRKACAL
ncbi:serine hydrolase [Nevskia sp.]|uniref:serine hydrolase n=1 Tax=Nevskia sp. TaxID=1929292 RepID=UPI0025E952B8|nr:serine hydrolase [Nevskia sp.]